MIDTLKFNTLKEKLHDCISQTFEENPLGFNTDGFQQNLNELLNKTFGGDKSTEKQKLKKIKAKFWKNVEDILNVTDILIEGYDKNTIIELMTQELNNFPAIKTTIDLMLTKSEYPTSKEEALLISLFQKARNYLFHRSVNVKGLLSELADITSIRDEVSKIFPIGKLYENIHDFETFLKKLTFHILGISVGKIKAHQIFLSFRSYDPAKREKDLNELNKLLENYGCIKQFKPILKKIHKTLNSVNKIPLGTYAGYIEGQSGLKYLEFYNLFQGRLVNGSTMNTLTEVTVFPKGNQYDSLLIFDTFLELQQGPSVGFRSNLVEIRPDIIDTLKNKPEILKCYFKMVLDFKLADFMKKNFSEFLNKQQFLQRLISSFSEEIIIEILKISDNIDAINIIFKQQFRKAINVNDISFDNTTINELKVILLESEFCKILSVNF